jgi:hypothetical protein
MTTLTTTISGAYQVTEIVVTTSTYTVANITNPFYGQTLVVIIKNSSGGALTVTWGSGYSVDSWVNPASGSSRGITFYADASSSLYQQIGDYATSSANLTGPITSVGAATTIVGPIPAVTLSGTMSGGGNQINNVTMVVNSATTNFTQKFQSISSTGQSNAMFFKTVANATGPDITIAKSRNGSSDPTAFTAVQNGDTLGALQFGGTDGSALITNGVVGGYVDGVVSAGVVPTALTFATGPTNAALSRMNISSAGIVTMYVYGAGTATFSAAGVISSVSDETYKIKDGVIADPMPMLMALEPGYYFGKPEANMGDGRQLGFYAQNVRAAIGPEAAPDPEPSKPWGYFDRSVLAVAIEAIKVQKAQIDALTARIAALEAKS